jgi:glycerol-3-phosphate dehydrogenase subunit B
MDDLLIIGAGLAGLSAAYTAAKNGLTVRIITKGLATTHWNAGTVDVLGYNGSGADDEMPRQLVKHPLDTVAAFGQDHPGHPYALLTPALLANAIESFKAWTQEAGLPYVGANVAGNNWLLPSPIGAARPTFLAPRAQTAGDLQRQEPFVIVGFRGLRDFFPELIASNLTRQGHAARAVFLPLELLTDKSDRNTIQLAHALDDSLRTAKLGRELKGVVKAGERIGLPAILGLDNHVRVVEDLRAQSGAPVFEVPTLPPSVPGVRLHKALTRQLGKLGVRIEVNQEAIGFRAENGRIAWVETATSSRPLKHRAKAFLLATGGILGAGFNTDHNGRVWEVVFDLPITVPQRRSQWFHSQFMDPSGHPVFQGGVTVNRQFQPIGHDGQPVYGNLWAAGSLLADADPINERSLEGIAVATGVSAAQQVRV